MGLARQIMIDRFLPLIGAQACPPLFPADAARPIPAKGGGNGKLLIGINPDRACPDSPRHAPAFRIIARPQAASQTIIIIIGKRGNVALIFKRQHHQHRAEYLLSADARLIIQPLYNGRQKIGPILQLWLWRRRAPA